MTVRVALFPGSFDPVHNGHMEIIEQGVQLFDELVVAVVRNPGKGDSLLSYSQRLELLDESLSHLSGVRTVSCDTLTVRVAADVGASVILRGLRAVSDFENEMQMAQMNQHLSGIATVFVPSHSSHSFISSRLIREVARLGGDVSGLVPGPVGKHLAERGWA
jgi:pantetheine-phosphate adenylyltransferase